MKLLGKLISKAGMGTLLLSSLWIFAMFNYLYADVLSLMDPALRQVYASGQAGGMRINQITLLLGAILMQTAMLMVVLPRILPRKANRIANIVVGAIHSLAVLGSLFVGSGPAPYYILCASFEVPTTILIIVLAATWKKEIPAAGSA